MPPDLSVKRIDEIEVGSFIRVVLLSRTNRNIIALSRSLPGGQLDPMPVENCRRIVGASGGRSFTARVTANTPVDREIELEIRQSHTTSSTQVRYRALLPYRAFIRMARLVAGGREFVSTEKEQQWRRQRRANPVNKEFFHPTDRFVAVSLIGLVVDNEMVINFTHQVSLAGTTITVPLPASAFEDDDYTVTWAWNTFAGGALAAAAIVNIPDSSKTATEFVLTSTETVPAGTTVDFHVKSR